GDVVERHAAKLRAAGLDHEEAAVEREMSTVLRDLDDAADHEGGPGSRTRPRMSTETLRAFAAFILLIVWNSQRNESSLSVWRCSRLPASWCSASRSRFALISSRTTRITRSRPLCSSLMRSPLWTRITRRAAGCATLRLEQPLEFASKTETA